MKILFVLFSVLISQLLYGQIPSQPQAKPVRDVHQPYGPFDTMRVDDLRNPGTEYVTIRNAKGTMMTRGKMVEGKKDGVWREYSINGNLIKIEEYNMGKKEGASVTLTVIGMVTQDSNFKGDSLDGQKTDFAANGKIKSIENYSNGTLNGVKKTFYDDGKTQEESNYKNGVRDGNCKWFLQSGKPSVEYNYSNGVLNGPAKEYDSEGRVQREGNYKNNNEDGEWKQYKDSVLVKRTVFKDGEAVKELKLKK